MGTVFSAETVPRVPPDGVGLSAYLASPRAEIVTSWYVSAPALSAPAVGCYPHARDREPIAVTLRPWRDWRWVAISAHQHCHFFNRG